MDRVRRKISRELSHDDRGSLELYTIETPSFPSKTKQVSRPRQWRKSIGNSIQQRRSILKYKNLFLFQKPIPALFSKALMGRDESFIQVRHHNHYLKSLSNKRDKHQEIITINVSGNRYETRLSTLEKYPDTLLGNKDKRKYYWSNEKKEYFFDRHRACFEAILYYYQSNGRLRRPNYVPLDTFIEEISFFDLGPQAISQTTDSENVSMIKYINLPSHLWRRYIWYYLEYPQNSIFARVIYFTSMFLTVLSCVALAVETLPKYDQQLNPDSCQEPNSTVSSNGPALCLSSIFSPFFIIQTICVSYFTIEFVLRLISTPSYKRFLLSPLNWIDLSAIIPYFVFLGFALARKESDLSRKTLIILRTLRLLRFLRVFKIHLIFKQLKTLRVLSTTLKESFLEFIIMIVVLTLLAFLFGAAVFLAEQDANGEIFDSIPRATYWAIITITTVGYGDMYPVTVAGQILTCICSFFGLATSAILVSVLVERYQRIYNRKQFLPEQVMALVDSSDSEHDEKQDFINRKLSGLKRSISTRSTIPPPPIAPPAPSSNNDRRFSECNSSSSYVRFIITLPEDEATRTSADEMMRQLSETIQSTGEEMNLKLISTDADPSNYQKPTTNELPSIFEE